MGTTLLQENHEKILNILNEAKDVALRYYKLTNKPLGITGEIAEHEAATLLGLSLCSARQSPDTMRLKFWTGKNIEFKSKVDICLILKKSLRELVLLIYLSHLILFF